MAKVNREEVRTRIKARIRKKVSGTSERPRLSVYFSNQNVVAQVVNDDDHKTLAYVSTHSKDVNARPNVAGAELIGGLIADKAIAAGVKKLVFDRAGYLYHGKVKALADAVRAKGIQF
jgi:large subunit ribosomal protein L18